MPRNATKKPERLEKQEQQMLSLIRKSQQVEIAYGLVQQFVTWIKEHNAQLLDTWLLDCQQSGMSDLVTFAQALEKEGSALHAAFTLPYPRDAQRDTHVVQAALSARSACSLGVGKG